VACAPRMIAFSASGGNANRYTLSPPNVSERFASLKGTSMRHEGIEVRTEFERIVESVRLSEADFKIFDYINPFRANVLKDSHRIYESNAAKGRRTALHRD
jgi:hypothetical protein